MKKILYSIFFITLQLFSTNTNAGCSSKNASVKQIEVKFTNNESKLLVGDACKVAIARQYFCSALADGEFGGVRVGCFDSMNSSKWLVSLYYYEGYDGSLSSENFVQGNISKIRPKHKSFYGENCKVIYNTWVCRKWNKLKDVNLKVYDNTNVSEIEFEEYFGNKFKIKD